jgi:CMP-N-acetylneuraminic acid synthetase
MTKRTLAIITARTGSKRVPGKNIRSFCGKPLIAWTIEFAKDYPLFDSILITTDSEDVVRIAGELGVKVPWLRPKELSSDSSTTIDVVLHAIECCENSGESYDYVALLQPTTPIRSVQDWNLAFQHLKLGAKAVVGVTALDVTVSWIYRLLQNSSIEPCLPVESNHHNQPVVALNGALYLIDIGLLKATRTFTPNGVKAVKMAAELYQIDIDTEDDWLRAEVLVENFLDKK